MLVALPCQAHVEGLCLSALNLLGSRIFSSRKEGGISPCWKRVTSGKTHPLSGPWCAARPEAPAAATAAPPPPLRRRLGPLADWGRWGPQALGPALLAPNSPRDTDTWSPGLSR